MDFFEHQEQARKKTLLLVILFMLACACIVIILYIAASLILSYQSTSPLRFNPELFLVVLGVVMLIVGSGSLYKISRLSSGGPAVASLLGGKPIPMETTDPREKRLLNVVEEMAIASGVPVPEVYILPEEDSINAFAAGTRHQAPSDTVIGVTRGCLERLSREELQGVIAHEFSHILSGDMRLNIRLMGVVHGILLIGLIGYYIIRGTARGRSSKGKGQAVLVGLALVVIGYTGTAFGNMIKAAVSRQREFLADASSVQFTRNPSGIAGALGKIAGWGDTQPSGSLLKASAAHQASHFYFAQGVRSWLAGLFATHPPIEERILRLDVDVPRTQPSQDPGATRPVSSGLGEGPQVPAAGFASPPSSRTSRQGPAHPPETSAPSPGQPIPGFGPGTGATVDDTRLRQVSAIDSIGAIRPEHLAYARELLNALPAPLIEAIHSSFSSCALIYALLLSPEREIVDRQLDYLRQHAGPEALQRTRELHASLVQMDERSRILLVELALAAVSRSTSSQYSGFRSSVHLLINADNTMDLFEWMVLRTIQATLEPRFNPYSPPGVRYTSLASVKAQLSVLLTVLSRSGSIEEKAIAHSFDQGADTLGLDGLVLLPPDAYRLDKLDACLDVLNQCAPRLKKQILKAAGACIGADRTITSHEGELLRAVSAALECPMPLVLPGQPLV